MEPASPTGYRQVKSEILRRITSGLWPAGTLIPGEIALAAEFQCARATVNRALRELSQSGYVARKRRSGTRVLAAPERRATLKIPIIRHEIEATGAVYRYALVRRALQPAPDWLRGRLALAENAPVLFLECMHYADDAPFQFEERWISIAAVPGVEHADFSREGPNEWLIRQVPYSDAQFSFHAAGASKAVAAFLSLAPGAPVFCAERMTWNDGGAVTFARMSFHAGYRLKMHPPGPV